MESECLTDVYQSPIPLSYCCQFRTVKGQEYRRVELYEGEIPENCRDRCIYTNNLNTTSTASQEYFCFTKRDNFVAIHTCKDLDKIDAELRDFNNLQRTSRQLNYPSSIVGCPSYEHLQGDPSTKGKCAYIWTVPFTNIDNIGSIFGFTSCKGEYLFMDNNTQWTPYDTCENTGSNLMQCKDAPFIQDIIVTPGCNLITYGQPEFQYFDLATPIPKKVYIDVIQGPNTIHEYKKLVQSMVCSCSPVSEPKDDWEVILECDNRQGVADTTCNYERTVGTSYKYTNGTGGNEATTSDSSSTVGGSASASASATASASAGAFGVSAKVSATIKTSISASFSKFRGRSQTTGVDWSKVASNSFEQSVSISLKETVKVGDCLQVKQAVGYFGQAVVRTNVYKMTSC